MARAARVLVIAVLATGTSACVDPPEFFSHDIEVASMHPPDGSAAVPSDVAPKIVFSQEIPEQVAFEVVLNRGNQAAVLDCRIGRDTTVLECPLDFELNSDAWYRIEVDIGADGELDAEAIWTTGNPEGLAYDVGPDMSMSQLGGNDSAVTLLEDLLLSGDDHLVLVMDRFQPSYHTLPWSGHWLLGNTRVRENLKTGEMEAVIDEDDGLTISTEGTLLDDGTFSATSDYATLPMELDGHPHQLLLEDVRLNGNIPIGEHDFERVQNVKLTAAVSEAALDDLAQAAPEWARVIADIAGIIELDVDLDGDGTKDAATFQLSSSGDRITLAE